MPPLPSGSVVPRSCRVQSPGTEQKCPMIWGDKNRMVRFCADSVSLVFWLVSPLEKAWPPNFPPKLISTTKKKDRQKSIAFWFCGRCASPEDQRLSIARGPDLHCFSKVLFLTPHLDSVLLRSSLLELNQSVTHKPAPVALNPVYLAFIMCT